MDKAIYVKRLKKMLIRYPDDTCNRCPINKKYGPTIKNVTDEDCRRCQGFVGLTFLSKYNKHNCPCYRPNAERAVARAWQKIGEYEKKHGEIKV